MFGNISSSEESSDDISTAMTTATRRNQKEKYILPQRGCVDYRFLNQKESEDTKIEL